MRPYRTFTCLKRIIHIDSKFSTNLLVDSFIAPVFSGLFAKLTTILFENLFVKLTTVLSVDV